MRSNRGVPRRSASVHGHAAPAQGFHVAHQPKRARRRAGSARASRAQALRKPPECGASAAACGGPSTAQPKGFIAASIIARRQLAEPPCTGAGGCARTVSSPALAVACALPRACACAVQKRQQCRLAQAARVNCEPGPSYLGGTGRRCRQRTHEPLGWSAAQAAEQPWRAGMPPPRLRPLCRAAPSAARAAR